MASGLFFLIWGKGLAFHFGEKIIDKTEKGEEISQSKLTICGKMHHFKDILLEDWAYLLGEWALGPS